MDNYFCGWYFKCQSETQSLALIPALHVTGGEPSCSLQLISNEGQWNLPLPSAHAKMEKDRPLAAFDNAVFTPEGMELDLHTPSFSASGSLRFGPPSPIRYDIMGPFRYVPFMECRHSVYSMSHRVDGSLTVNGTEYVFQDGQGYMEGDRGRSFPQHYAWTQCFFPGGSLMLSVAEIPIGPARFTGVIGIIQMDGKEYRLATYLGARAVKVKEGQVIIRQGALTFSATLLESSGHPLHAPQNGAMVRTIRENISCRARYCLREKGTTILAFESPNASFEFEYP